MQCSFPGYCSLATEDFVMLQYLSVCACVCHMNEPLEKSQTHTHRRRQLWHTASPPYPILSQTHCLKQRGHKCEAEPVKPGNTDTPRCSKVNRRLILHSPANESKAASLPWEEQKCQGKVRQHRKNVLINVINHNTIKLKTKKTEKKQNKVIKANV